MTYLYAALAFLWLGAYFAVMGAFTGNGTLMLFGALGATFSALIAMTAFTEGVAR